MLKTVLALGLTAALALTAATTPAAAVDNAAGTYKMDRSHSSLVWRVSHIGLSFYTARFNTFDATLEIDPENPTGAKLAVTVDPTSLKTGYPFAAKKDFDKKLITDARFFNANEHPEIKFVSTGLEMTGDKTAKVTGDLTLLGVTKPITLDVTLNGLIMHPFAKKPALGFSGSTKFKRSDFGMTYLVGGVGDEVELLLEAEFIKE